MTTFSQVVVDIDPTIGLERIISQYQSSPRFKKWVNIYLNESRNVCVGVCSISTFFDIDRASGVWLDVLGRIVGQKRAALDTTLIPIFAFDDVDGTGFDEGIWTDGIYGTEILDANDVVYRRMIKAKALKNASNGLINDVIKGIIILTGGRTDFRLTDMATPFQFGIFFDAPLDATSYTLLTEFDLLPRGLVVELTTVTW